MWKVCLSQFTKLGGNKLISAFPLTSRPHTVLPFPQTQSRKENRKCGLSLRGVRMRRQHKLGPASWGDHTMYVQHLGLQKQFRARRNILLCSARKTPSNSQCSSEKRVNTSAQKPQRYAGWLSGKAFSSLNLYLPALACLREENTQWVSGICVSSYCVVKGAEEHMGTWYPSVLVKLLCISSSGVLGEYTSAQYSVICLILNY